MQDALHPRTLVIADDDPDDRELIGELLEELGLANEVRFVHDGEDLMSYLHRNGTYSNGETAPHPNLILLDLNMPKKNGLEALQEIKSHESLRHIPVVVLTTSKSREDIHQAYDLGANGYLTKPSGYREFREALQTLGEYWFNTLELPPQNGSA